MPIDLNCDLGESFGAYTLGQDGSVMPFITSANVACGFHAGDPLVMQRTVALCKAHGVAIGAHPGYRDLAGFGRREIKYTPAELYGDVLYQIGALAAFCQAAGVPLHHVKPHGALYNVAARDQGVAAAVCQAVRDYDATLLVYAPPASELQRQAEALGLRVVLEAFADRAYNPDGSLVDRRLPGAVIHDPGAVAERVLRLAQTGQVEAIDGSGLALQAGTICVHGDTPGAVELCRRVADGLRSADLPVVAP